MPKRRLTNIATRHQVFLERLKVSESRDFQAVFAKIDKATRDVLLALDVPDLGKLTKKQLTDVLTELRATNGDFLKVGIDELYSRLEDLAAYEAEFESRAINSISKEVDLTPATPEAAYKYSLSQPLSASGELLQPFIENWSAAETNRINNTIRRAWGEGWTVQETAQAIRGTKALGYSDGILATSRRNAQSIVRTSIQHVANTARMATWDENKDVIQGYRFVATLDSVTTEICRSLDGKVFNLGEGPVPPMHINCRSTTVAEVDPSLKFLDEGATRSAEFGPVPADQTYYEWLQEQSAEFQDIALGPTRGQLFRDGGLSVEKFAQLQLGKNFQPLTLDEMQQLEPAAFAKAGLDNP